MDGTRDQLVYVPIEGWGQREEVDVPMVWVRLCDNWSSLDEPCFVVTVAPGVAVVFRITGYVGSRLCVPPCRALAFACLQDRWLVSKVVG